MVDYFGEFGESAKDLWRKPVLFLPFILQGLAFLLIIFLAAALAAGLYGLGASNALLVAAGIPVALLLLIGLILLQAWFAAGQFGMVDDVVMARPTGSASFFSTANRKGVAYFLYTLLLIPLYLLPALPGALFVILAIAEPAARAAWIILAILFILLFLAAVLLLSVILFFGPAILIREDTGAWEAIRRSLALFKERPGHVWASWGVTVLASILLGLGVGIIFGLLGLPFTLLAETGSVAGTIGSAFITLLRVIAQVAIGIILLLYLFRMHKAVAGKAVKKR